QLRTPAARGTRIDDERVTAIPKAPLLLQFGPVDLVDIRIERIFVVRRLDLGTNLVVPQCVGFVFQQLVWIDARSGVVISTGVRRRRTLAVSGPEPLAGQGVVIDVVILLVLQHDLRNELILFGRVRCKGRTEKTRGRSTGLGGVDLRLAHAEGRGELPGDV